MTTDTTTIPAAGLLEAPLSRRLMLTLFSTAGLSGLYGLYATVVTPLVSPTNIPGPEAITTFPAPPPPPENVRMAEQYLPSQPWAATAKYQFRTKQAIVYANEWEPAEENQAVRFRPFAMIYLQKDRKDDQPPITVVGESAYLKFEKKFDSVNPDPGRVIAGALQGNVRIAGPDGLAIVGRNFIYNEKAMRLWSDENVLFAWSSHRGRGYGLQVELIADESAEQSESIAVTGVQSIRLRRNVAVDLSFQERDGKRSNNPFSPREKSSSEKSADRMVAGKSPDAANKKPDEPVEVRVRSTGSFEFDAEANVGTFSDHVRVYRPTGVGKDGSPQYDSLHCDQLTLSFEPKMPSELAAATSNDGAGQAPAEGPPVAEPAAPREQEDAPHRELKDGQREGNFRNLTSQLEFRRARARGKQVILISETNDLTAHLTDLIYDVQTRVASLTNPELVKVVQGTSELQSPGVTLMHDPHGKLTSIWCQGPGWLKYRDPDSGTLQLAAQWQRQLRKYPEAGDTGLDIIELEQQALVRQPEQKTGLAADFIRLWMNQQDVRATRPGEDRSDRSNQVRLKRMLALKDVALVSPEMQGETNRLEVTFEDRAPAEAEQPRARAVPPAGDMTTARDRRQVRPDSRRAATVADAASVGSFDTVRPTPAASVTTLRRQNVLQLLRPVSGVQFAVDDEPGDAAPPDGLVPPAEVLDLPETRRGRQPARTSSLKDSRKSLIELPKDDLVPPPRDGGADLEKPDSPKSTAGEPSIRPGDGPIQVYSDIIRVRAVQGDGREKTRMEEVWTEGNVYVTQEHGNDDEPLELIGDKLHVENRSDLDQVLHVTGAPAHIYDRGMHIEGKNVHLDRVKNKAWVDGAGLLQLPVKSGLNGEKLTSQQLLDVWWKEKMTFDGEYSRFYGDVRSVLNDSKMLCQAMEVKLTSRISFTARERDREVKVETVDCRDGVQFDSTEYVANKLSEVRKGHVSRFTLDQTTGRTQAYGPGHIMFWRRGNGRRAALGPGIPGLDGGGPKPKPNDTPRAASNAGGKASADGAKPSEGEAASKPAESNQWEYTRVDFVGKSDGNVQQRFTTFEERVNVVYGPVDRPLATVDPDALPKEGGWMRCDTLRLQQHAPKEGRAAVNGAKPPDGQKPQGHIELLGSGNCELDGRTFHAQADTISFDESKGLYVLRSLGNRKATISRQKQIGGEYSTAEAQRMEFVPSRNQLRLDRATSLDGIQ